MYNVFKLGAFGLVGVLGFTIAVDSWYTVNETERAVVLRYGKFNNIGDSGLNFKLPVIDDVERISTAVHTVSVKDAEGYSFDRQPANFKISVNYSVKQNPEALKEFYSKYLGSTKTFEDRVLFGRLNAHVKTVFGKFNAEQAIQERDRLNSEAKKDLQESIGLSINIDAVNIEDIQFSPAYIAEIENKQKAEIEVARFEQNARRETIQAQINVTRANGEAESKLAVAIADAKAIQIRGEAEAKAIEARGKAVQNNPGLVALQSVERWDGKLPVTMLPGTTLPFINVK